MKMSGNTVLITGGATSIGYALAENFLRRGNKVLICCRTKEKLQEAKRKHPEIETKVCDVSDEEDREELYRWVTNNFGDLNIIVNNAGVQKNIDLTKGLGELKIGVYEMDLDTPTSSEFADAVMECLENDEY